MRRRPPRSHAPLARCTAGTLSLGAFVLPLSYIQHSRTHQARTLGSFAHVHAHVHVRWRTLRVRRAGELAEEEAATAGQLVSLKAELEAVDEKVREKRAQIRFAKGAIIKNDSQIERLLAMVVRA